MRLDFTQSTSGRWIHHRTMRADSAHTVPFLLQNFHVSAHPWTLTHHTNVMEWMIWEIVGNFVRKSPEKTPRNTQNSMPNWVFLAAEVSMYLWRHMAPKSFAPCIHNSWNNSLLYLQHEIFQLKLIWSTRNLCVAYKLKQKLCCTRGVSWINYSKVPAPRNPWVY